MALADVLRSIEEKDRQASQQNLSQNSGRLAGVINKIETATGQPADAPGYDSETQFAGDMMKSFAAGSGNLVTDAGQAAKMAGGRLTRHAEDIATANAPVIPGQGIARIVDRVASDITGREPVVDTAVQKGIEKVGQFYQNLSEPLLEAGKTATDYWTSRLSDTGKTLKNEAFYKHEGIGNKIRSAALQASESVPATLAIGMGGAPITATLKSAGAVSGIAKVLERTGLSKKVAGKAADWITTGLGYGTPEGIEAALSDSHQVGEEIAKMPPEQLAKSPKYVEYYNAAGKDLNPQQRHVQAVALLQEDAEALTFGSTLAAFIAQAPVTGGGMFDRTFSSKNWIFNRALGGMKEAVQEYGQESSEAVTRNLGGRLANPDQDLTEGAAESGLAATGPAFLMGIFGAGAAAKGDEQKIDPQLEANAQRNQKAAELERQNLPTRDLIAIKNNPVKLAEHGLSPADIDAVLERRYQSLTTARDVISQEEEARRQSQAMGQDAPLGLISRVAKKSINQEAAERVLNQDAGRLTEQARVDTEIAEDLYQNTPAPEIPERPEGVKRYESEMDIFSGVADSLAGMEQQNTSRAKDRLAGEAMVEQSRADTAAKDYEIKAKRYNQIKNKQIAERSPEEQAFLDEYNKTDEQREAERNFEATSTDIVNGLADSLASANTSEEEKVEAAKLNRQMSDIEWQRQGQKALRYNQLRNRSETSLTDEERAFLTEYHKSDEQRIREEIDTTVARAANEKAITNFFNKATERGTEADEWAEQIMASDRYRKMTQAQKDRISALATFFSKAERKQADVEKKQRRDVAAINEQNRQEFIKEFDTYFPQPPGGPRNATEKQAAKEAGQEESGKANSAGRNEGVLEVDVGQSGRNEKVSGEPQLSGVETQQIAPLLHPFYPPFAPQPAPVASQQIETKPVVSHEPAIDEPQAPVQKSLKVQADSPGAETVTGAVSDGGSSPALVEHITKKGKVLRGVVRKDLSKSQAKEIDQFSFPKDGGFFIREQHLSKLDEKYPGSKNDQTLEASKIEPAKTAAIEDPTQEKTKTEPAKVEQPVSWFDDQGELTPEGAKEQLARLEKQRREFEQGELSNGRVPIFDARKEQKIREARDLVAKLETGPVNQASNKKDEGKQPETPKAEEKKPEPSSKPDEEPTLVIRSLQTGRQEEVKIKDLKKPDAPVPDPFAGNKIFTGDAVAAARARLKAKRNTLSAGFDPELMQDMVILGGAYFEAGIRKFAEWSKAILSDIGQEFKPFLRGTYENLRYYPGLDTTGINSPDFVDEYLRGEQEAKPPDINLNSSSANDIVEGEEQSQDGGENHESAADNRGDGEAVGRDALRQDDQTAAADSDRTLEEVAAEGLRGNGADELRPDKLPEGGGKNPKRNKGTDGGRVSTPRGRRGNAAKVHPAETGTGDDRGDGEGGITDAPAGVPALNFQITDDVRLGKGGETTKFNDNVAAIRTLKQIQKVHRRATPEEQKVLARYVGWGGLANAFRNPITGEVKEKWEDRVRLVEEILSPDEIEVARNSTQNAHYTSAAIVRGLWQAVQRMGFSGGNVLEPSVGTGNFIGLLPETLAGKTNVLGVEYDNITAGIAKLLYPQSAIIHSGFEALPIPRNAFDLVIGNPPFGKKSLNFKHSPEISRFTIHNQFFLAGIDALRPGGIQALVVSRYLMDAEDSTVRELLAQQAKLIGAIRLPQTAFKENAMTDVVTDIIFLQKLTDQERTSRNSMEAVERAQKRPVSPPAWTKTALIDDPLGGDKMRINNYFQRNPGNVLGQIDRSGSMRFRNEITVKLEAGIDLEQVLAEKISSIVPQDIANGPDQFERSTEQFNHMHASLEIALSNLENGSIFINDLGQLEQILDQEIEGGDTILTKRILTEDSVWSPNLDLDKDGNWFRQVDKEDENGNKVKVVRNGRLTKLNEKVREVFKSEADIPASLKLGKIGFERLTDAIKVMDALKKQINLETEGKASGTEIEENRKRLSRKYRAFVEQHGRFHSSGVAKLLDGMPNSALLFSLETSYKAPISKSRAKKLGVEPKDEQAREATILTKRVVFPYKTPDRAESHSDALAIILSEYGRVEIKEVASLLDTSEEEVIRMLHDEMDDPLIFRDPEKNIWETADEYLGGNVIRKLEAAKAAGLEKNIQALEKIKPEPWTAEQVTATMGATWIPPKVYAEFIEHLTGSRAVVQFSPLTNTFTVVGDDKGSQAIPWNTPRRGASEIISSIINSQTIRVTETISDGFGGTRTILDQEATDLALTKAEEIKAEFDDWVYRDSNRRNMLVDIFNKKNNVRVTKQRNGQHLKLPGKVPDAIIKMRRHQLNAIWRGIVDRFVLYDHAVGAGKTFTGIARAMERRRMGLSRKPMMVVPNHLVEQFAADVYKLYPGAKLLAAGKKDLEPKKRRRLFAKIATGDWDIVIVPHSSFKFIGISPATEERYLKEELTLAEQAIEEAWAEAKEEGLDGGRFKPLGVKMAEALRDKITERLEKIEQKGGKKDRLLTFEQLGVDDLTVDEAHEFKNLFYHSKLNVRGMNPKEGSGRAYDLWSKIRVLRESQTGSIAFMTGTPISNSAVEMYVLMRYLAAEDLEESGISHFDAWRAEYSTVTTKFEPTESGRGLKDVNRIGREWMNMRALMDLYYTFADSVSNEDIINWYSEDNNGAKFPIPNVKGGGRVGVNVSPTAAQRTELERIVAGFEGLDGISDVKERNAERLRLMDQARKVSLDVRAVDPLYPSDEAGGKLETASKKIHELYQKWTPDKGTQLVFLDRSVPKAKGDVEKLRKYDSLLARLATAEQRGDEDEAGAITDELDKFDANEMREIRAAQESGWNAYQQIKDNLIKLGIPASEIRFVQEANTDQQKADLFEEVNSGAVRVLIGSTPRMGAGTNVQERLVGLHHVDVTWKPSDIEQREGRIIRQGNSLLEKYGDKFEVEILAYTTDTTIDAKLWSLNATKLKMINGIRKYSGEFNMEFDDEESVSMSEIAAIASGEPMQLERVQLAAEIDRLERQVKSFNRQQWGIKDSLDRDKRIIDEYPPAIEVGTKWADLMSKEFARQENEAKKRTVEINGKVYTWEETGAAYRDIQAIYDKAKDANKVDSSESEDQEAKKDKAPKFKITINGNEFRSLTKANAAIVEALGDQSLFDVQINGKRFIRRNDAAGYLGELANEFTAQGKETGKIATLSIGPMDIDVSIDITEMGYFERTKKQQQENIVPRKMEIFFEFSDTSQSGTSVDLVNVQADVPLEDQKTLKIDIRGYEGRLFRHTLNKVENIMENIAEKIRILAKAKAAVPELEKLAAKSFPKQEELESKKGRLKEVEAELAARGKAKGGGATSSAQIDNSPETDVTFSKPTGKKPAVNLEVIGEATDERSQRDGRRLQRVLEKVRERRDPQRRMGDPATGRITPVQVSDAEDRAAQSLAGIFGKRVVFIRNDSDLEDFNGVTIGSNPKVIYINVSNDNLPTTVLGHELVHLLEVDHPGVYRALASVLTSKGVMNRSALQAYIREYNAERERLGEDTLDDTAITAETIADFMGDNFSDPQFWEAMADYRPNLFKKLVRIVVDFVDSVIQKITGKIPDLESHRFFDDIKTAREAAVIAMSKYAEKQQGREENFRKWFGESKITRNGQPHVMYHGTADPRFLGDPEYDWTFDTGRATRSGSSPLAGLGIFLGDKTIADAHSAGTPGTTHPFYVRIERPYVTTAAELEKKTPTIATARAFRKRLEELEDYDGIIIKDRGQVIVFAPNQLKSAISNTGEFSRENDDVRFSKKNSASFTTSFVKGTTHSGLYDRPDLVQQIKVGSPVDLVRDPANAFDQNAIKVMFNGQHIGFIDRRLSASMAKKIDAGEDIKGAVSKINGTKDAPRYVIRTGSRDAIGRSMTTQAQGSPIPRRQKPRRHGQAAIDRLLRDILGDKRVDILNGVRQVELTPKKEQDLFTAITAPGEDTTEKEKWISRIKAAPKVAARNSYNLLTLRQLREIYRDIAPVEDFYRAATDIAADTNQIMSKADDTYNKWAKLERNEADTMSVIMSEVTVAGVHPDRDFEQRLDIKKAREKIDESADTILALQRELLTVDPQKAEHLENRIKWHDDRIVRLTREIGEERQRYAEWKRLAPRYNHLSDDAKAVYQAVRKLYDTNLLRVRDALHDRLDRTGLSRETKKMAMEKIRLQFEHYLQQGPYFPLSRFGEYVVIKKDAAGNREVHFFDYMGQRNRAVAKWAAEKDATGQPRWSIAQKTTKDYSPETDGASSKFVVDLANLIDKSDLKAGEKSGLIDEVNQLFIKSMPDMSHRKHFAHRKKIEGYSRDQIRAFAANMQHAAHHIARIKHADKLTKALSDLNDIATTTENSDISHITDLYNTLNKRHGTMMNPKISPVSQALTSFGFVWNIGPSIASALVNMTQTPLVSFPMMAARFKDSRGAFTAIRKASSQYMTSPWEMSRGFDMSKRFESEASDKSLAAGERMRADETKTMLQALIADGTIDVTMAHDLAQATSPDLLNMAKTKHGNTMIRTMRVVSYPFHVTELANRQITAVAAYNLARAHNKTHAEAIDAAREIVLDSHFDYSQANRAPFMEGNVQRVIFLFKQYSQQMTFLLGRSFYQAVKGESQEVKDIARKQLMGILAGHFLVSGTLGMPVLGSIGEVMEFLVNLFGDDDEPWDWEVALRNALADTAGAVFGEDIGKDIGEMVSHGPWRAMPVLGQWDVASRLSLGDLWLRTPDKEAEGIDKWNQYLNLLLGPLASNGAAMFQGLSAIGEGKTVRGIEMMMPKAVKDGIKTFRYAREGVTSWNDATLIEDLRTVEMFGQFLGFTPSRVNELYEGKSAIKNVESKLEGRRHILINQWIKAVNDGDDVAVDRIMRDIIKFSTKNQVFAITQKGLKQSMDMRQRVQAQTKNGVYLPAKREELLKEGRFSNI